VADVGCVADQVPIQTNQVLVGVGNDFGVGEFDEVSVILNQLVGIDGRRTFCVEEYVSFAFIADYPRPEPTDRPWRHKLTTWPCRVPREKRFLRLGRLGRGNGGFCVVWLLPAMASRTTPEQN